MKKEKHVAIYSRVSSVTQDARSQMPDLEGYAARCGQPVKFYTDKTSGTTMDRPGFNLIMEAARRGEVHSIVIWRLDRLGRNTKGLATLFEELLELKVNLKSLTESLDLSTSFGRMIITVLTAMIVFETEVRKERQAAGIAVAKSQGRKWGGRRPGTVIKVTPEHERLVRGMVAENKSVALIARTLKLSRPTIYKILKRA